MKLLKRSFRADRASNQSPNFIETAITSQSKRLPANHECIAHLKLLAAFANLRKKIAETDGLFNIHDNLAGPQSENKLRAKIREKRWAVYVTRAVGRFEKWWEKCVPVEMLGSDEGGRFCMADILRINGNNFRRIVLRARPLLPILPPLDVFMVLHSFMLNPRLFLEDCIRHGKLSLWYAGFPWALIDENIDNKTFEYRTSDEMIKAFTEKSGLSWDNLDDPAGKVISCTNCAKPVECSYTDNKDFDPCKPFETSTGFADKSFNVVCSSCSTKIDHQALCIRKFRSDMQTLLSHNIPMPGTLLSVNGVPQSAIGLPRESEIFFPNRLLLAGLAADLEKHTNPKIASNLDQIRMSIERSLKDRLLMAKANGGFPDPFTRGQKIAIRRMMSRYWENSSPFALDLVGAVLRQGVFVGKMQAKDWIHFPTLESTITRLITKYSVFFRIMALNPGHIAVPTLDVDLAWHTHQLSPPCYYAYAVGNTGGIFIDHDDKIEENKLSTAFEWTSKAYQELTGAAYSECMCWYCEAIRESHDYSPSVDSSRSGINPRLHNREDAISDPEEGPHISTHNAVGAEFSPGVQMTSSPQHTLERQQTTELRRKRPVRCTDRMSDVWGYEVYMPDHYPYQVDMCISGEMYACNLAGNCAAGSCASASGVCGNAATGGDCAGKVGGIGGGGGGGAYGGGGYSGDGYNVGGYSGSGDGGGCGGGGDGGDCGGGGGGGDCGGGGGDCGGGGGDCGGGGGDCGGGGGDCGGGGDGGD